MGKKEFSEALLRASKSSIKDILQQYPRVEESYLSPAALNSRDKMSPIPANSIAQRERRRLRNEWADIWTKYKPSVKTTTLRTSKQGKRKLSPLAKTYIIKNGSPS